MEPISTTQGVDIRIKAKFAQIEKRRLEKYFLVFEGVHGQSGGSRDSAI